MHHVAIHTLEDHVHQKPLVDPLEKVFKSFSSAPLL